MHSTKNLFIYLFIIGFSAACGGSKTSTLDREFQAQGETYCEEVNQVVDIALANHFTKSESDRYSLYNEAMNRLFDSYASSLMEEGYYDLVYVLSDLKNELTDYTGSFNSDALADCSDLAELHAELTDSGVEFTDERAVFWAFLAAFSNQLDYFSRYHFPSETGESYQFGIRLDLDLATNFNHTQDEAVVLAVADPESSIQPGDRVIKVEMDYLTDRAARDYSYSSSISIEDLTSKGLARLFNQLLFASPDSGMGLTYIPKDSREERYVYLSGNDNANAPALPETPLVQAELSKDIIYVRLFEFGQGAAMEMSNKIHSLRTQWLEAQANLKMERRLRNERDPENAEPLKEAKLSIILDLRFNPGGSIWELRQIAGLFLPTGQIGVVEMRDGGRDYVHYVEETLYSESTGVQFTEPLIVLANNGSASASDILTQALVESGRAFFVGTTTFGKGIQQSTIALGLVSKLGGYFTFTSGRIYGVNGSSPQNVGVKPNLEIEDPLVAKLARDCKESENSECRIQFMKDLPSSAQIPGGSIMPVSDPITSNVTTEFDEASLDRAKALTFEESDAKSSERVDVQRRVAEELLQSLAEDV